MIPVEYYASVYYGIISTLLVIFFLPHLVARPLGEASLAIKYIYPFLLLLIAILFIGLRDPLGDWRYFGDTSAYTRTFNLVKNGIKTEFTKDIGFYTCMKLVSYFSNVQGFYLLSAFIYVYLPYLAFKKWFKENAVYVLIAFIVSMSFWAFGINGVRNGLATSIFLFSLRYFDKKWLMYVIMILSVTFHKAMLLPLFAYLVSAIVLKTEKQALIFWIVSIPLSLLFRSLLESFTELLFSSDSIIQDERASTYFSEGAAQKYQVSGEFRFDFIIYSAVAIFVGYWVIVKKGCSTLYRILFRTYLVANGIWILLIYAPFTNRIAYLSWFLMPIILTAPFISDIRHTIHKNKIKLIYVIFGSLAFTLIMEFI